MKNNLKILVIGSGAREHALVWKIKQSPLVSDIFVMPGNAGTGFIATNIPIKDMNEIVSWLEENPVDLVVVTPDDYLAMGLVNKIQEMNIAVFGPTKSASQIEWSKAFAKQLMKVESIPTANFKIFTSSIDAIDYVKEQKFPLVIKADGLALGKGVVIADTLDEAIKTIDDFMVGNIFGLAGKEIVIEEYLEGKEISIHVFCDGTNAVLFPASKDHKRIHDGDQGPNTGGMGTVSPIDFVTEKDFDDILKLIVSPLLSALVKRGNKFQGILFPGIMITETGPKVIEFNARFGDPETESYMRLLDSDIVPILFSCVEGTLDKQEIIWKELKTATVMLASGGYPLAYEKGKVISGLENIFDDSVVIFHAGTTIVDNKIVTNGGRVLAVSAIGENLEQALYLCYESIKKISFDGMQYRHDIGNKLL